MAQRQVERDQKLRALVGQGQEELMADSVRLIQRVGRGYIGRNKVSCATLHRLLARTPETSFTPSSPHPHKTHPSHSPPSTPSTLSFDQARVAARRRAQIQALSVGMTQMQAIVRGVLSRKKSNEMKRLYLQNQLRGSSAIKVQSIYAEYLRSVT